MLGALRDEIITVVVRNDDYFLMYEKPGSALVFNWENNDYYIKEDLRGLYSPEEVKDLVFCIVRLKSSGKEGMIICYNSSYEFVYVSEFGWYRLDELMSQFIIIGRRNIR